MDLVAPPPRNLARNFYSKRKAVKEFTNKVANLQIVGLTDVDQWLAG